MAVLVLDGESQVNLAPSSTPALASGVYKFALEVIAVVAIVVVTGVRAVVSQDIAFGDEVNYMMSGLSASSLAQTTFQGSATYVDAYFLLSRVTDDPIGLYFAMRVTSAVAFVAGFWLAARFLVGPPLAWSGAAVLAALPLTYVWPGVSGLAVGALLIGSSLVLRFPSVRGVAFAASFFWLAAGSRPEFVWLAIASSLVSVSWLLFCIASRPSRNVSRFRDLVAVGVGAIAVPGALIVLHGSPLTGGRAWVAFAQHYSLHVARPGEDPWLGADAIVARDFPAATSVFQALLENPGAMMQHWASNVGALPGVLLDQMVLNASLGGGSQLVAGMMLVVVIAGFAVAFLTRPYEIRERLAPIAKRYLRAETRMSAVVIPLILIAALVPVIVVFPRHHYLLGPVGLGLLALLLVQHSLGSRKYQSILPFAGTALAFIALSGLVLQATINRIVYPAPIAKSLSLMRTSEVDWRVLSSDWGLQSSLGAFVPDSTVIDVNDLVPAPDIADLFKVNAINAIWLTDDLSRQMEASFGGFSNFAQDPEAYGFRKAHPEANLLVLTGEGS